jgi:nucleoid-associated protein YgaU
VTEQSPARAADAPPEPPVAAHRSPPPEPEAEAAAPAQEVLPSEPAVPAPVEVLPLQVPEQVAPTAVAEVPADAVQATPAEAPEEEIPTLTARRVGGPDARRFASGTAIIRRGDNLWSIARRVYGTGLKYTTIYRANRDQIRNPARIYPGQVFELPLVYDDD